MVNNNCLIYKIVNFCYFCLHYTTECNDSALVMFVDSVEEFYKSLMESINLIVISQRKDRRVILQFNVLNHE